LRRRRTELRAGLRDLDGIDAVDRVVLAARLGDPPAASVAAILTLDPAARVAAIFQLSGSRALMAALPWQDWMSESPDTYGEAAAEAASRARLRRLLPALRRLAASWVSSVSAPSSPSLAAALRAFGELGDRDSVPLVVAVMTTTTSAALRPQAMEALGRIGGDEARTALRAAARGSHAGEARAAYRALTFCAGEEEQALFRAAAGHADWYVRLMAVEVLGRRGGPENIDALTRLTADPVPAVAGRALSLLES
jgi:HEAT repeat protein